MLANLSVKDFVAEVASSSPAPGGGSVSALSAALGAGLVSMLASLTVGKKGYEECNDQMAALATECTAFSQKFTAVIDEDSKAFDSYMDAIRMPKDTDAQKAERSAAMQSAAKKATGVPLQLARDAFSLIGKAEYAVGHGNKNALSDGAVAAILLRSAVLGAILNVRINLPLIKDEQYVAAINAEINQIEAQIKAAETKILSGVSF